jgi:solute carrier family 6 amino acid/orphan transporter-like 15/16/17/18/20
MWLRIANMAHHVGRQNSKRLNCQRILDRLKELRESLVVKNGNSNLSHNYGATNIAFNDTSPNTNVRIIAGL